MEYGLEQLKKLEDIYLNSNLEIKELILSRVLEIESEIGYGTLIYTINK